MEKSDAESTQLICNRTERKRELRMRILETLSHASQRIYGKAVIAIVSRMGGIFQQRKDLSESGLERTAMLVIDRLAV